MIKQRARATAVECGFIRHVVALPYTGEAGQPQGLPLPYTKRLLWPGADKGEITWHYK
jgi:hypothetical protein